MSRFVFLLLGALSLILGRHGAHSLLVDRHGSGDILEMAQYYHVGSDEGPPTFGLLVNRWENESSNANDLVLTFGYKRKYDRGWAAIGLGENIDSSPIFMTFGRQSPDQDLILSVRDGRDYTKPRRSQDLPQVEVRAMSFDNSTRWLEISFVCFGCDDWAAKRRPGMVQSFVWAFNEQEDIPNANPQSEVSLHTYTGGFALDTSKSEALGLFGGPVMVPINPTRPNQHDLTDKVYIYSALIPAHGSFLGLAMLFLYPCGVLSIRYMPNRLGLYLFFQVCATISCIIGAAAVILTDIATGWVTILKEPHALFGIGILLLILPQLLLGCFQRRRSTAVRESPRIKNIHLWLGRSIIFGGIINTIVGMESRGFSTAAIIGTSFVAIFDFVMMLLPTHILWRREDDLGHRSSGYDTVALLDDSEELK